MLPTAASDRSADVAVRLRIAGRVHGVGFRASLCDAATRLGLSGWVRNRSDGSVEALAHGAPANVERLVAWTRRGPPAARVTSVDRAPADPPPHRGFEVWPTI